MTDQELQPALPGDAQESQDFFELQRDRLETTLREYPALRDAYAYADSYTKGLLVHFYGVGFGDGQVDGIKRLAQEKPNAGD